MVETSIAWVHNIACCDGEQSHGMWLLMASVWIFDLVKTFDAIDR